MFSFFKKKPSGLIRFTNIKQDIHSHILPGIDDGAHDIETSLQLVTGMCKLGITKAVATPHIIGDLYRNNPEIINKALEKLKTACIEQGITIELCAAAEYMLDDYFMELLRKKATILPVTKNLVLTEISYTTLPNNLENMAFEIITNGYQPIMAHPERYFYYHKNYDNFFRLKELGFLLQVNLLSLTSYYGAAVTKAAKFIVEKGLADLVGTDMHHTRNLEALSKKENQVIIQKALGDKIYNDFSLVSQ